MKLRFFNMIEVLLALAITAVGITGLMGIIPLGLNANRDAMAESFVADIANSYFATLNIQAAGADSFASFVSTIPFEEVTTPTNVTPESGGPSYDVYANPVSDIAPWTETVSAALEKEGVNFPNDPNTTASGKRYMKVRVGKKDSTLPDFEADLCGWKCFPKDIADAEGDQTDLVRVYLEVSWPVRTAYDKREKRIFVREFYNAKADVEEAVP
ncbi:MAG: hypothetical protein J5944_05445 [Lentisphaeria bacterium]|nr:hypothetical protein [Lentisphaeria bacterium]